MAMFAARGLSAFSALLPVLGMAGSLAVAAAQAQGTGPAAGGYPHRTVRIVVPFPAGGPTDILSRVSASG
jgi:tripartite-type tricarboxylate transporter receptor subunit TctC